MYLGNPGLQTAAGVGGKPMDLSTMDWSNGIPEGSQRITIFLMAFQGDMEFYSNVLGFGIKSDSDTSTELDASPFTLFVDSGPDPYGAVRISWLRIFKPPSRSWSGADVK